MQILLRTPEEITPHGTRPAFLSNLLGALRLSRFHNRQTKWRWSVELVLITVYYS